MSISPITPASVHDYVHVQFVVQCHLRPDAEALATRSKTWTYQALEDCANELSQYLKSIGVTRQQKIGICFRKSAWAVVSMLAVLKAGASCVPLDPDHPKARIETIIEAASISAVLLDHPLELFAAFTGMRQVAVNDSDFAQLLSTNESEAPTVEDPQDSTDIAFTLFTSGSTGVPKAVLLSHSAICSSVKYHGDPMGVGPGTRVYQNAAYTFDMSIYDIFTTLIRGGTVCIPGPDTQMHNIAESVNELRSNWAFFTPTLLSTLLPAEVPGLSTILLAGEAVSQDLIDVWADKTRLLNGYGSTEMSTCFLTQLTRTSDPRDIGVPQGVATRVVSLDNLDQDAPTGYGQLVVCGPVLASGYLGQTSQTTGFVSDSKFPDRVAYRTGDLVERTDAGSYLFHGRCDTMVKIRGYRVEMGEVESQLLGHPLVEQVVVLYPKNGRHSEKLTAVVQLKAAQVGDTWGEDDLNAVSAARTTLSEHLHSKLPKYMVPQCWLAAASINTTSSGKIDRRAIASAVEQGSLRALSAPQTQLQIPVNPLRQQVTPPESVDGSIGDSSEDKTSLTEIAFLDLGLDSINLIGLSKILKKAYDVDFNVATLGPLSMATLLPCIRAKLNASSTPQGSSLPARPRLSELFRQAYERLQQTNSASQSSPLPSPPRSRRSSGDQPLNVLLTGATGFVGSRILQLLLDILPAQSKIVSLVRAPSAAQGHQRLVDALSRGNIKLSSEDVARLEVWLGDLTKPNLGLESQHLSRLRGNHDNPEDAIDVVIHNGAYVNWTSAYETVSAANVNSTIALLQGLRESRRPSTMVYVSGGRALEVATNEGMRVPALGAHDASNALDALESVKKGWDTIDDSGIAFVGYDITKLISDALVQSGVSMPVDETAESALRSHVIRPGYIIGDTKTRPVAEDYIWRVVATALSLGKRCEEPDTSFLYLSGVDDVCEYIVAPIRKLCDKKVNHASDGAVQTNITAGVTVHDFWATVSDIFATKLVSQPSEPWIAAVDKSMSEQRPLYPVMEAHRADAGMLGVERQQACEQGSDPRALQCLEKSLRYLQQESDVFKTWIRS
jgi:amino acid adenylation domain-containing protein/thioester reductase-like protein